MKLLRQKNQQMIGQFLNFASINDVTVFGERGQGFYNDSTRALVIKTSDNGVKNCVTSFMDNPLAFLLQQKS